MKIHDNFLRFNIILVTSLLVSCAAQPPVPEDNFYQLPAPQITARAKTITSTLSVKRLVSDGLHSERALLFSKSGQALQLKQYHYHHWSDTPPRMIQEHLISALRNANVADTVANYDPVQRTAYKLSGKIRHFEQIERGNKNEVLVELELRLNDKSGKLVLLKDYRITQVANSASPHDLVNAYGIALNTIIENFIKDWVKK
ncbi:MAG: membrane integrity-associated transporter subunit PqiC [Sulfuriflexus sp.]|nr:membrane integrity-associated transporter subunit PqiC [Sulfuriflexus sp.]